MNSFIKAFLQRKITAGQLANYLRYKRSPKSELLNYDPITLSIQTSGRCNLKCSMCQTNSLEIPKEVHHYQGGEDISFQTFKEFVDQFKNALTVCLIGAGEPFLNKDFFSMVEYAVFKRKMHTLTITNGTIIGDKIGDILESGLHAIEISLNGHNAEEFERMTGQPEQVYAIISDNIRSLVDSRNANKSKLKISLSFILDRVNYKDVFRMIEITEKLKADEVTLHNFLPSPVQGFSAEKRCLYSHEEEVVQTLQQLKKYPMRVKLPRLIDKSRKEKYCKTYFELLRVDGQGNVGGCAGQLLNMSGNGKFNDCNVWNNAHFRERRKIFIDPDLPELQPCKYCWANTKPLMI